MFPNLSELVILVNLLLDTGTDTGTGIDLLTKESHKIVSDVAQSCKHQL